MSAMSLYPERRWGSSNQSVHRTSVILYSMISDEHLEFVWNQVQNLKCYASKKRHEWLEISLLIMKICVYFCYFSLFGYSKLEHLVSEGGVLEVRKGYQVPKAWYPIWILLKSSNLLPCTILFIYLQFLQNWVPIKLSVWQQKLLTYNSSWSDFLLVNRLLKITSSIITF